MVEGAFKGADESAEACFYRLGDLQVVISRASGRDAKHHEVGKRVTLELWPLVGPRVLVVEWIGRRPHVVHRRSGPWLQRLVRIARQSKPDAEDLSQRAAACVPMPQAPAALRPMFE